MQARLGDIFPNAVISTAYGMTEACSSMTFDVIATPSGRAAAGLPSPPPPPPPPASGATTASSTATPAAACVGLPAPGVQVKVVPEASTDTSGRGDGQPVVGEVWTRGPHVMTRYWRNAPETAKALTPDGWLRTGALLAHASR